MAYVRTVKTDSGARAVQIVHSQRWGSRDIEHIGSAHTDADLELLKAVARQRMAAGQGELDLQPPGGPANGGGPLPITSTRAGHLLDALGRGYHALGFTAAAESDEVSKALVLARIIEPTSKIDSVRVLDEAGAQAPSYAPIKRRLRVYATGRKTTDTSKKTEGAPIEDDAQAEDAAEVQDGAEVQLDRSLRAVVGQYVQMGYAVRMGAVGGAAQRHLLLLRAGGPDEDRCGPEQLADRRIQRRARQAADRAGSGRQHRRRADRPDGVRGRQRSGVSVLRRRPRPEGSMYGLSLEVFGRL